MRKNIGIWITVTLILVLTSGCSKTDMQDISHGVQKIQETTYDDSEIKSIKAMQLDNGYLLGDLVENYMGSPTYELFTAEGGQRCINISGNITYMGKPVVCVIQYEKESGNGVAERYNFRAIEFNEVPQPNLYYYTIMSNMVESYEQKHGVKTDKNIVESKKRDVKESVSLPSDHGYNWNPSNSSLPDDSNNLNDSPKYEYEEERLNDYPEYEYEEERSSDYYILPTSSYAYLTEYDLYGLSSEELRLARNEIYARHGRVFKDEDLQEYFNHMRWYQELPKKKEVSDYELNDYEKENIQLIKSFE